MGHLIDRYRIGVRRACEVVRQSRSAWYYKPRENALSLPSVKDAIPRGRPLIAGFDQHIETVPVGGHGIQVDG